MFKDVLGVELNAELYRCRMCANEYNTSNGWSSLRRHFHKQHREAFDLLMSTFGPPSELSKSQKEEKNKESDAPKPFDVKLEEKEVGMEKEIKTEANCEEFDYGGPSSCLSPSHPDLQPGTSEPLLLQPLTPSTRTYPENHQIEVKPTWCPKGRSIVWEHITFSQQTQRASCNYCQAEFQIKGGTSALLRHLKTIHPAAINFDPENPPPVARRKRRKEASQSDYTIVTADTRSYMDNLLEQFLVPEEQAPLHLQQQQQQQPISLDVEDPIPVSATVQSRADSEIDEVIRSLAKESAQNGGEEPEPDQDIRRLLGIEGEVAPPPFEPVPTIQNVNPDEEKQVSSSSSTAKKRKADEMQKSMDLPSMAENHGKFLTLMSQIRRGPPPIAPSVPTSSTTIIPTTPSQQSQQKYHQNAMSALDFEAKVLQNQSMHSTIAREDAMAHYYRIKSRKLELEIKKLERELGEPQEQSRATSPDPDE